MEQCRVSRPDSLLVRRRSSPEPPRGSTPCLVPTLARCSLRVPAGEPLVISANPQTETKTLGLWDRDVCEIFIAPDPAAPTHYYEFEAAPTREWIDLELQTTPGGRETNWEFRSGMTTAARIDGNRIVVAMRIPWSRAIGKPAIGDQWRINLCRCIGKDPDRGYVAWQPTRTEEPNFHVPRVFGSLLFAA